MIRLLAALAVVAFATPADARNVCKEAGLRGVPLINCELAHYVHKHGNCPGREVLVTSYGNGDGYLGKPVKCGGVLNSTSLTVAHKHLACGTKVVFLSRSGRRITATVTDSGPFTDAEFDLSPAMSAALGVDSAYVCKP